MDYLAMIALCSTLNKSVTIDGRNHPTVTPQECYSAHNQYKTELTKLDVSRADKKALSRIIYAEAANQGDLGQAFVLFTILNRTLHKNFPEKIVDVINQRNQFEPATKVSGWINLPEPPSQQNAKLETMINLALQGVINDPTGGALFFQNTTTVAAREKKGVVSKGLTNFNGSRPVAKVNDHTFYREIKSLKPQKANTDKWDVFNESASLVKWDAF